jgi:hypothetical protein
VLDINPASNEARASFLTWLLRTAKVRRIFLLISENLSDLEVLFKAKNVKIVSFFQQGGELQWCKLVFFWDWYGFDQSTTQTAQIYAGLSIRKIFLNSLNV